MNTKELKLFALEYIQSQDNITPDEKFELGLFVVEATKEQVSYLLTNGHMVEEEVAREAGISNLGGISGITQIGGGDGSIPGFVLGPDAVKAVGLMAATAFAAFIAVNAYKVYQGYMSNYGKKCRHMTGGLQRDHCIAVGKVEAFKREIATLKKGKSLCSKNKDPQKCSQKIEQKIQSKALKMKGAQIKADKVKNQMDQIDREYPIKK